jgi:hypothetical protein
MERDIVFFLGAGFSADAGLPTMEHFGEASERELAAMLRHDRYAKTLLHTAGTHFEAFREHCTQYLLKTARADGASAQKIGNMETLFCIAEILREAQIDPELVLCRSQPKQLIGAHGLIQQIQLWLWNIYRSLPPWSRELMRKRPGKIHPEPYEAFMSCITEQDWRGRISVVTTNYDLLVEHYLWATADQLEWCAKYPLVLGTDCKDLPAGACANPRRYLKWEDHEAIPVCKLHGSVNYFDLGRTGDNPVGVCDDLAHEGQFIGKSSIPVYERGHQSAVKLEKRDDRPAILAVDAIWALRERYGNSLVPAIIPPTYAKLQGHPWLRKIWKAAFRAIQNARLIVFIGYSMPPSDGFMRAMFQAALAAAPGDPPEIYVINPFGREDEAEAEKEQRRRCYKDLFPLLEAEWAKRVIEGTDGKFVNCVDTWKEGGKMHKVLEQRVSRRE